MTERLHTVEVTAERNDEGNETLGATCLCGMEVSVILGSDPGLSRVVLDQAIRAHQKKENAK